MKIQWKMLLITLIAGIPAFLLGQVIWPPSPEVHPTAAQLPYLIVLSAIEALTFGFGIAFIVYGWRLVKQMDPGTGKAAGAMYVSLAWLLVSWWPHDNLHIHNALNINGLIAIDYLFHVTLILAGLALAYSFFALFNPVHERVESAKRMCDRGAGLSSVSGAFLKIRDGKQANEILLRLNQQCLPLTINIGALVRRPGVASFPGRFLSMSIRY